MALQSQRWPGGQHANTSDTKVEVRFDIAGSPSLGPRQRARLQERLGDEVRVVAADERSQARNRELALERLCERLAAALRVDTAPAPDQADRRQRQTAARGQATPGGSQGRSAPSSRGVTIPLCSAAGLAQ